MKILTTLAEDSYFLGVAALLNSIVKQGAYIDKAIIGYRGDLPAWWPEMQATKNGAQLSLPSGLQVELIELDDGFHMVHEKPNWFLRVSESLAPEGEEFFFFDSDIVVINRMSFFGEWVKQGVGICEDVNYDMSPNHPIRLQWGQFAKAEGMTIKRWPSRYYNSGFLAWRNDQLDFIRDWVRSFEVLARRSGDMTKFRVYDRSYPVLSANQDSLNLAVMVTDCQLSTIGPEAMGFHYGFPLMAHPIGAKPWKRSFFREFLKGLPPRHSDLLFWQHVNGSELQPFSKAFVNNKIRTCQLLKGLARFYGTK